MILSIIKTILGILFVLFIPGYLLSWIFFRKLGLIERVCVSIGLSIVVVAFLSFFLTGISYLPHIKGITSQSVWISLLITCLTFTVLIISKYKKTSEIPFLRWFF